MKKMLAGALLGLGFSTLYIVTVAHAADVPCEDMLADLRARETAITLSAVDQATYEDLKAKGIERCNADDDQRADEFFAQALTVLGQ